MTSLGRDRFWILETGAEFEAADRFASRRFGALPGLIGQVMEEIDPFDVVYPDNPGEYNDVVRELLACAYPPSGRLGDVDRDRLADAIRGSLLRCFGESPEDADVRTLLERIYDLDLGQYD